LSKLLLTTISGLLNASKVEAEEKGFKILYSLPPSHLVVEGDADSAISMKTIESVSGLVAENTLNRVDAKCVRLGLRSAFKRLEAGRIYTVKARVYGGCFSEKFLKLMAAREIIRVLGKNAVGKKGSYIRVILDCKRKLLLVARQVNEEPLHLRGYYVAKHPSPLNPVIAASIPFLAEKDYGVVYDPFCGSGTIPIEYASIRKIEALCSDINPAFVEAARANAEKAGVLIEGFVADVRRAPISRGLDFIATDPPRGDRLRITEVRKYIKSVFKLARDLEADICLVTPYSRISGFIARENEFKLSKKISTFQGGSKVYLLFYTRGGIS